MHVHVGIVEFLIFAAMYIVLGFLLRVAELRWADRPIGKALAFVH